MNGRTFSRYLRKRGRSHCHQYTVYIAEWSYIYLGIKHFVEFILLTDVRGMGMSRWGWKRGWGGEGHERQCVQWRYSNLSSL